jgi:TrmH family RNA methyltransferase
VGNGIRHSRKKGPLPLFSALLAEFRAVASAPADQAKFAVEGETLIRRALADGLPVTGMLHTSELAGGPEGRAMLDEAAAASVPYSRISKSQMGTVTTTRPVPAAVASVWMDYPDASQIHLTPASVLLITDGVASPDNLGMVLRTADAAGVDAVLIGGEGASSPLKKNDLGEANRPRPISCGTGAPACDNLSQPRAAVPHIQQAASPFHRNCVRAARGAVGRIPLFHCRDLEAELRALLAAGFEVLGASARGEEDLFGLPSLGPPLAFVVGNETEGVRRAVLDLCTRRVRIPMAPGQSSLNVAVATGILLYELVRGHAR